MKTATIRFLLVLIAFLSIFEIVERLAVTRPESWEEKIMLLMISFVVAGLIWSVIPAFAGIRGKVVFRAGLFAVFAASMVAIGNFYAWNLRPNMGFYEEPHWVAKHPAFQKQQQEMIERNRWR